MADLAKKINTRYVMEKHDVSQSTAWRWLNGFRQKYGDRVVRQAKNRRGSPLETTLQAIRSVDPAAVELREIERAELEAEMATRFRARTAALERTIAAKEDRIASLEIQVRALTDTVETLLEIIQGMSKAGRPDSEG